VVGEARDGIEAARLIEKLAPRLVFLDIGLPGKNGLELGREIFDLNPWTFIVFVTASSDYRSEAIDVYAFDYLVKPFKLNRLRQTIARINELVNGNQMGQPAPSLFKSTDLLDQPLFFRSNNEYFGLNSKDIIFVTKEDRKTVVYHTEGKLKISENLTILANMLKNYGFLRSHKGFVVNLAHVKKITPFSRSNYELTMSYTDQKPLMTWEIAKKIGIINNYK